MQPSRILLSLLLATHVLSSCNNGEESPKKDLPGKPVIKNDSPAKPGKKPPVQKPPIINIVDTVAPKRIVAYMKDSAASFERIGQKLGQIYGVRLAEFFKRNGLKASGQPMAWYLTQKPPVFFEAGIPVNKKPAKASSMALIRELAPDSVVVAHFYGPYDMVHMGYEAIGDWLKDHHKIVSAGPYEIYVTDPLDKKGKPLDPYKVQTDIVFPRK
jgi:effector-binding domain-containing protein